MTFIKGQSGNPSGRPKDLISPLARKYGPEVIQMLIDVVRTAGKNADRIKAGEILLDRGFGKAQQAIELTGAGGGPLQIQAVDAPPQLSMDDWIAHVKKEQQQKSIQ